MAKYTWGPSLSSPLNMAALLLLLLVGALTVEAASRPSVYAQKGLEQLRRLRDEMNKNKEDMKQSGDLETPFNKYFRGGDSSFTDLANMDDQQLHVAFYMMSNPNRPSLLTLYFTRSLRQVSPGVFVVFSGGKVSESDSEGSRDEMFDTGFSPPAMNASATPGGDRLVHVMECTAVEGKIDCSGLAPGAKQPLYRGGIDATEVFQMVQPRTVGPAEYDEERPDSVPDYLSPADFMTLQRFTQAATASSRAFLEDPVNACLAQRRPTYICTLLQEFAATSVILEESGNLVCEAREAPSGKEIEAINASVKGQPVIRHGALAQPSGGVTSSAAGKTSSSHPPKTAGAASADIGAQAPKKESAFSKLKSLVPSFGRRRKDSYDVAAGISQLEEAAAEGEQSEGETAEANLNPPPYNPNSGQVGVPEAVVKAYEEARPLQQQVIDNFKRQVTEAAAKADDYAQASAYNAMQNALAKVSAGYHVRAGTNVIMSSCKRLLETLAANPPGNGVTVPLDTIRLQLISALTHDFAVAQAFLDYPLNIVQSALDNLSRQTVATALLEIAGIEELIHETAGVKSRLAAKGADTAENVRKEVLHEAYRQLKLELFQEIVVKVCDVIDNPDKFVQRILVTEPAPTTPLRTGGHLAAEYILHLRDDLCDVTSSDAQIFPSAPADEGLKDFPRHNLGERIMGWMDVMVRSKTVRKDLFKIIDFTKTQEVLNFANESWKAQIAELQGPATPAPGFYAITSSGCRNVNDEIKRRYFDLVAHNSAFMKLSRQRSDASRQRLVQKVAMLHNEGVLSQLPLSADYELMELADAMQKNFVAAPKQLLARRKAKHSPYGYLELCDLTCFRQVDKLHNDVMSTVFFSLDGTLMKVVSKVHRAYGIAKAFFQLGPNEQHIADPNLGMWARRLFNFWEAHNEVRNMQGVKTVKVNYKKLEKGEFTLDTVHMRDALVRYVNMLKADPATRDLMNLVIHTWIQVRGLRNAAKGFKDSKKVKDSLGESAVGAVFSKLWYEHDVTNLAPHQHLKPFGAPLASVALQIGFFLHTAVEEYKMSIFEKAGAQIKSWFMGIFSKNKRRSIPRTWQEVVAATRRQPRIDLKKYQGGLLVLKNLARMFRERFLHRFHMQGQGSRIDYNTPTLLIHALVALWMDPTLSRLDLSSPHIHQAKKLFWYNVWVNENGPSNAAARIVLVGCKRFTHLDAGVVRSVTTATGEVVQAGSDILKISKIRVNRSSIESYMNLLQASYEDPLTVIQVALDLAERCEGYTSAGDRRAHSFASSFAGESAAGDISAANAPTTGSFVESKEHASEAEDEDFDDDENVELFYQDLPKEGQSFAQLAKLKEKTKLKLLKSNGPKGQAAVATPKPIKVKAGSTDSETSAAILGSKFMLDLWCIKYKNMVVAKLAGIKTTDVAAMQKEIEKVYNAVGSIKIAVPAYKKLWDISIRCDWMVNYPDQDKMRASRAEMVSYALSKAGTGKKIKRALQKASSWIKKKALAFSKHLKRLKERVKGAIGKASPAKAKVRDWATVNAGLGHWTGKVYTTHLTFNEDEMACNGPHEPIRAVSWKDGFTTYASSSPRAEQNFVLCKVADGKHCWATREALFYKGWTGTPLYQHAHPAGFWLEEIAPSNGIYVVNRDGYLTTGSSLTLQDIFASAEPVALNPQAVMRIIGSDGNLIYEGPVSGVVQTPGGAVTMGSIRQLVSGVQAAGDNIEVRVNVAGPQLSSVAELSGVYKGRPDLYVRDSEHQGN
ncbi:rhoptry neck protein RON5 [Besnoitia besnoiti]|uniref:Rhoptry neck protein RON5 n=1 Tax=Besnoitia besnoiti TaxID=94643 RepID=A0A2A9M891_BESBE|nr:rhoptry neck protein RON5 [Besnoitia besnoiti]PFH34139.1 rhoptry neck protein RON5 [Besnoitia besnoiti]